MSKGDVKNQEPKEKPDDKLTFKDFENMMKGNHHVYISSKGGGKKQVK